MRSATKPTKTIYARIDAKLHTKLRQRALAQDRTVTEIIEDLVAHYVAHSPRNGKR